MPPRTRAPRRWSRAGERPALVDLLPSAALLRAPSDRPRDRRALQVLRCVDLWRPSLLATMHVRSIPRLGRQLASVPWRRPPDTWRPGDPPLVSLIDHLVRGVRYPLPGFLYGLVGEDEGDRAIGLLSFLGDGGAIRDAPGLPPLSRRAAHLLWQVHGTRSVIEAVRLAQVEEAGGPAWLAEALRGTRLGREQPDEGRWAPVVAFLARHAAELDRDRIGGLVDYLASGVPLPTSVGRLLREEAAWHAAFVRRAWGAGGASGPLGAWSAPLPRCGLEGARFEAGGARFVVVELASAEDLVAEGAAMGHCVATYVGQVRVGRSSIWSLRRDGERLLTLEVWNADRAVVQIRGHRNRRAAPDELAAVERWAGAVGLTVRDR